ncbi:MAG TPA: efflux transporter outer membrane subunit, partial [Terriglobales bacterium]|nr:efflux transporter outer membrane subunit [Terriglobales bacterium]
MAGHFPVRGAAAAALSLALGLTIASTACTVGPNYRRPVVSAPGSYRGAVPAPPAPATTTGASAATAPAPAFGDESWTTVFQDPELQGLIRTALRQNFDVRIAAARVAEAQAQLGVTRGDQFPSAGVDASGAASRNARSKFNTAYTTSNVELGVGFQWNLDFWGKYRRATEAARDQLLATDWAQRAVASSLVANLAAAYYGLRAQDLELAIAQRTLAADLDSLKLTQLLADNGATSMLDVRQAQELVAAAGAAIPLAQKQIAQQENLISILLGENPGAVVRGLGLDQQPHPPQVPAGLPSSLLERRPDIREAEAQLMAVNARIGVAKAAYFPAIALTGSAGTQSLAL